MNNKFLIYLLPVLLLACKKQSSQLPAFPTSAKALASTKSININGHMITVNYSYNDRGQIYQEDTKDEDTGIILYQQYWHKDGVLQKADLANDDRKISRINYHYQDGRLSKIQYFEVDKYGKSDYQFERNLEYKNGQVYKISTINNEGLNVDFTIFGFFEGNVVEKNTFSAKGSLVTSCRYEYDHKLNPCKGHYNNLQDPSGYNQANIIKSVLTDYQTQNTTTKLYSYKYNSANQPTAMYSLDDQQRLLVSYFYQGTK